MVDENEYYGWSDEDKASRQGKVTNRDLIDNCNSYVTDSLRFLNENLSYH